MGSNFGEIPWAFAVHWALTLAVSIPCSPGLQTHLNSKDMQNISFSELFTWWASLVANSNNSGLKHQRCLLHTWRMTSLRIEWSWCPLNLQRWDNRRYLLSEGYLSIWYISRRTATAFNSSFPKYVYMKTLFSLWYLSHVFASRKQLWYEVNLHFSTDFISFATSGERIF